MTWTELAVAALVLERVVLAAYGAWRTWRVLRADDVWLEPAQPEPDRNIYFSPDDIKWVQSGPTRPC